MKSHLKRFLGPFAVIWFISLFVAGFLAHLVTKVGADGPTDGLGRSLSLAPTVLRIIVGEDKMWAGWGWFLADMTIFWGSIGITARIRTWLDK